MSKYNMLMIFFVFLYFVYLLRRPQPFQAVGQDYIVYLQYVHYVQWCLWLNKYTFSHYHVVLRPYRWNVRNYTVVYNSILATQYVIQCKYIKVLTSSDDQLNQTSQVLLSDQCKIILKGGSIYTSFHGKIVWWHLTAIRLILVSSVTHNSDVPAWA